jgi:hypothetical protein
MLASVHLVDGSARSTVRALRRTPRPGDVSGLRDARALIAAPLGSSPPSPQLGRRGFVAMWDDETALSGFLATDAFAESLENGFAARLEPLRAVPVEHRTWPGLPSDLPTGVVGDAGGPTVVLTIGQLRLPRIVPFLRASARAEKAVLDAPGLLWATGMANLTQRIVATLSIWETVPQMRDYATGTAGHAPAIRAQTHKSFHHFGAFIRFRVISATGGLSGRNPLPESVAATLSATAT